jgi:hypothetical protein
VQGLLRTTPGVHEELRRAGMQDRVSDVPEILQEMRRLLLRAICNFAASLAAVTVTTLGFAAEEKFETLSGPQIRKNFAGMQLTDEVHWREVYERNGTLRSYAMGNKKVGKWFIHADELCLDLSEPDSGCFEVVSSGARIIMKPKGLGRPVDGILQTISDQ